MSTITPAPSERTMPSASSEKAWILPVGDSTPVSEKATVAKGLASRFTPPAIATSELPLRREPTAWWIATSEEEQAVSIATDGPRKSKA